MTMIYLHALQPLRLLLLLCSFTIFYLYSGHAMRIGERLTYKYKNKNFGTFDTAYQYFPATQKSSGLFAPKSNKPAVLCIHGFGGNACQFRKQSPVLAQNAYDTYAIDLLGYGYSDKPNPRQYEVNSLYNFDNWADQTLQFIRDVVRKPTVLVCNSIGGVVGLQTALQASSVLNRNNLIKEVVLIDVSLRLLHVKKQNALQRAVVPVVQQVLRETALGPFFFNQVATPQALKNILNSAYAFPGKAARGVDDEIVDIILRPGLDPGAVNVFLDFISYSGGPLPEELLPQMSCPVTILWGEHDPWEPLALAQQSFGSFPCVRDFIVMPGGGHCPMDQIPDKVNQELLTILRRYS